MRFHRYCRPNRATSDFVALDCPRTRLQRSVIFEQSMKQGIPFLSNDGVVLSFDCRHGLVRGAYLPYSWGQSLARKAASILLR